MEGEIKIELDKYYKKLLEKHVGRLKKKRKR